jgi:hypothetical protein
MYTTMIRHELRHARKALAWYSIVDPCLLYGVLYTLCNLGSRRGELKLTRNGMNQGLAWPSLTISAGLPPSLVLTIREMAGVSWSNVMTRPAMLDFSDDGPFVYIYYCITAAGIAPSRRCGQSGQAVSTRVYRSSITV